MRFLGFVFISILSTQVRAESFEDRLVFKCKDKFLEMGRTVGYKTPALLFRAEDGTYFSTYEKLKTYLESSKKYSSLPFQKSKATNASFLVYDKGATSETAMKEASLIQLENLEEKRNTEETELRSLTRIYNDEKSDRIKAAKPRKGEPSLAAQMKKRREGMAVVEKDVPLTTQMRKKRESITALEAEIEKVKAGLPKHLLIKDSSLTTVALAEAKSSYTLNLKDKCQVENLEGKTNPCSGAESPELCGAYTVLLVYDQASKDRAKASLAPESSSGAKSKAGTSVKSQN